MSEVREVSKVREVRELREGEKNALTATQPATGHFLHFLCAINITREIKNALIKRAMCALLLRAVASKT